MLMDGNILRFGMFGAQIARAVGKSFVKMNVRRLAWALSPARKTVFTLPHFSPARFDYAVLVFRSGSVNMAQPGKLCQGNSFIEVKYL